MSAKIGTISLCVLWEDELRAASRLLKAAHDAPDDQVVEAAQMAYAACEIALGGITDDRHIVMIAPSDLRLKPEAKP